MKTSSTYKLQRIHQALRVGEKPGISIRGSDLIYRVARLVNLQHSVSIELDRNGGFLVLDPDDISLVHVRSMPAPAND